MGRKWDTVDENNTPVQEDSSNDVEPEGVFLEHVHAQQAWHLAWLKEAFRVLKPGGVIKAFSATRTFHRLVAAMQEAGFVDVRLQAWVYGCLSEDTEILVRQGSREEWIRYPGDEAIQGLETLCFDMTTGLRWERILEGFSYDYDDIAFHLKGPRTDQLVSKNHRCLLMGAEGKMQFELAENLPSSVIIPIIPDWVQPVQEGDNILWGVADVKPVYYTGTVWCVKVPTGAFVARRNGKIFITGNSGFPKSLSISKALDKKQDNDLKREVRRAAVAAVQEAGLFLPSNSLWDWTVGEHGPGDTWWKKFQETLPGLTDENREKIEGAIVATVQKTAGWFTRKDIYEVRAPASANSKKWSKYGTAVKPAWESIVVGRKPE
jgi:hypothetical protein